MWLSHRIHRRFKFTVVNVKHSCYLSSSWICTTKEELFATYFTEGTTRMIGVTLCVNSWISKHCSQYRSDFQHQGSFSVLEQHLFFCSVQFSRSVVSDSLRPPLNRSTPGLPSITNSQSLPKLVSIESLMPSNHLIRCHPLLLLSSVFPNIRVFSNESALQKLECGPLVICVYSSVWCVWEEGAGQPEVGESKPFEDRPSFWNGSGIPLLAQCPTVVCTLLSPSPFVCVVHSFRW